MLCLLCYLSLIAVLSLDHCVGDSFQNCFCQAPGFAVQYYILVLYPSIIGSGITRFLGKLKLFKSCMYGNVIRVLEESRSS